MTADLSPGGDTAALPSLLPGFVLDSSTPPAFLAQAADDQFGDANALAWWAGARAVARAELNLFSSGGHGFGVCSDPRREVCSWTGRAAGWLRAMGLLD